jgi:hypothetical protein
MGRRCPKRGSIVLLGDSERDARRRPAARIRRPRVYAHEQSNPASESGVVGEHSPEDVGGSARFEVGHLLLRIVGAASEDDGGGGDERAGRRAERALRAPVRSRRCSCAKGGRSTYRARRSTPRPVVGRHPHVGVQVEALQVRLPRPARHHGRCVARIAEPPHLRPRARAQRHPPLDRRPDDPRQHGGRVRESIRRPRRVVGRLARAALPMPKDGYAGSGLRRLAGAPARAPARGRAMDRPPRHSVVTGPRCVDTCPAL